MASWIIMPPTIVMRMSADMSRSVPAIHRPNRTGQIERRTMPITATVNARLVSWSCLNLESGSPCPACSMAIIKATMNATERPAHVRSPAAVHHMHAQSYRADERTARYGIDCRATTQLRLPDPHAGVWRNIPPGNGSRLDAMPLALSRL